MISKIRIPDWLTKAVIRTGVFLVLISSAVISSYHWAYGQKIYPYITVGGIELSNLILEEAENKLSQAVPKELPKVEFSFGNQSWPIDLNELLIVYEPARTAQEAFLLGRSRGWWQNLKIKWGLWWRKKALSLSMKFSFDEEKLVETIELVASQIEQPPILPELRLQSSGQVQLIPAKNGRLIKKQKLRQALLSRIGQLDFRPVVIEAEIVSLNVSAAEMATAQARAESLKDKKLIFKYQSFNETLKGQELLDLIGFSAKDEKESGWEEEKIASFSARLASKVNRRAQDAAFRFDGQRVVEFRPALDGLELDENSTNTKIVNGLEELIKEENQAETSRRVELEVKTTEPKIKTEMVNDLGVKTLIGKGESTFHGSIVSREHNVALTAARLNGVLIAPGETFSFNQAVGDISLATGYRSAYIIKDGRTVLGDGGGVCQDSTTVFRAALDAGLPIVERHAHSYRVAYYEQNSPVGVDATVYAPSTDLKFKNDTPGHILVQAQADTGANYLAVELYGTSDGRQSSLSNFRLWGQTPPPADLYVDDPTLPAGKIKQIDWKAWGGKAAFDWKVVKGNEILQERTFYSSYQPWQAVFLRGTGG